jgi:hypothetical protein
MRYILYMIVLFIGPVILIGLGQILWAYYIKGVERRSGSDRRVR